MCCKLYYGVPFTVASHLPFLFHIVTLLVCTGPLSLRASTHGLVINIIHSLCTCAQLSSINGKTPRRLMLELVKCQNMIDMDS